MSNEQVIRLEVLKAFVAADRTPFMHAGQAAAWVISGAEQPAA